jgi:hypothetical protein
LGVLLGRNWGGIPDYGIFLQKKQAGFLDLGVLLGRNTPDFPIWARCLEETGRNSRFGRVTWKKLAGFLDLGVLLGRNSLDFRNVGST